MMMSKSNVLRVIFPLLVLSLACPFHILAKADEASSNEKAPDPFAHLKFRNLGPTVAGGRVTAVAGIPGDPNTYYVAGAAGGVFKSVDGGRTWKAIFEHEATASIGAIAVAPSNPNLIWVGTGEGNIRNDVIDGKGVYFSPDAGHSWQYMGLDKTQQISAILVDPHDSNTVFVAALGHSWAPNADRGVFKTSDGGKTWKRVLFVNDTTGAADLAMAAGNSKVLFATMWEFRRYPWTMVDGGPGSGLYRSTDGGETWKKLSKGLPEGPLGRIAVAVAPSNPEHVYALIAAKHGMLWQSLDMGDSWSSVNDSHALDVRPFYFSKLIVSPDNENKIFFLSFNLMESEDGGKTAHTADRGIHPDHHAFWIDPKNPNRIIQGQDGGAFLSVDGAKSWRFLDAIPIEQFYQVATDSRDPYRVCGGLQDNSAWCGDSSDLGRRGVTGAVWYTTVGGDGEYAVPAPSDPDIVYSDSQDGSIVRLDLKTHLGHFVRPYLESVEEMKPADLKYRFNWTAPIAVSPTDANEVYLGGNVLFKSTDGGKTWAPISGDLTRNDKSKQQMAGGPVQHDMSSAENYDTILAITLAPTDSKVIWVGTDDGLVQVTRDGGKTWNNVSSHIPGAPEWARVYQIGVSPFDAGTAYVTYDAHMLDNRGVYVYRTENYGSSWQKITNGLPEDCPAHVVREDPNQRGFLVAGTDTGLYFSRDRGDHWLPLKANFPTAPVWDLTFVKKSHDLAVATHGRGIFVLDDIRPLEEATPETESSSFHLFTPAPGIMFHHWRSDEGQGNAYTAPNAPEGAIIDYFMKSEIKPTPEEKKEHESPVKIVIEDSHGNPIATDYGPSEAGVNRFVWNMRYEGATRLKYEKMPEVSEFFNPNRGPMVVPGSYRVSVTVNGETQSHEVTVLPDPNLHVEPGVFEAQTKTALEARNDTSAVNEMINRIDLIEKTINDYASMVQSSDDKQLQAKSTALIERGKELSKKLTSLKDEVFPAGVQNDVAEDSIHELARLQGELSRAGFEVAGSYGQAPSPIAIEMLHRLESELDARLKEFNDLLKTDVAAYNKDAEAEGAPTVFAGSAIEVQPVKGM
jgi:photosystem II stability/assembly factor-like uncharacterized protein